MILYYAPEAILHPEINERSSSKRKVSGGPDGGEGVIYGTPNKGRLGYYKDQTWEQQGKLWVCIDGEVNPSDFIRPNAIDGHLVELGDGNQWLIPVARAFPNGTRLPESLKLNDEGELMLSVVPKYLQVCKDAENAWDWIVEQQDISLADSWEICVRALEVNYSIDRQEVSLLGLLTTENIPHVLKALIDFPAFLDAAKKKQSDDSNMNNGEQA